MDSLDFVNSIPFKFCFLMFRVILTSLCICGGIELFNFKNLYPFFTFKRLVSLFLLILGSRLLLVVVVFYEF